MDGLATLGITAVLNMAGPVAVRQEHHQELTARGILYRQIDAHDDPAYPLLEKHWQEAYDFLQSHLVGTTTDTHQHQHHHHKGVVVNCMAGWNRSVWVVCAYYMVTIRTPVLETVAYVRRQRRQGALQNEGFQQQLITLARQHQLLGVPPGTPGSLVAEVPPPMLDDNVGLAAIQQPPPEKNPLD